MPYSHFRVQSKRKSPTRIITTFTVLEHNYCLGAAGGFALFAAPLKAALALPLEGVLAALLAPFTTTLAWPLDGGFALLPIFTTALAWPLYGGFALLPIFTTELAWPLLDGRFTLLAPFTATLALAAGRYSRASAGLHHLVAFSIRGMLLQERGLNTSRNKSSCLPY